MLCTNEVAAAMEPGLHGTTFGGGPLACAVALAVIAELEQKKILDHVTSVGSYFKQRLETLAAKHDCVVQVRGTGLMLGVEINDADLAKAIAADMLAQRILLNRTSDVVLRFLPPFVIEKEHIDQAIHGGCSQEIRSWRRSRWKR